MVFLIQGNKRKGRKLILKNNSVFPFSGVLTAVTHRKPSETSINHSASSPAGLLLPSMMPMALAGLGLLKKQEAKYGSQSRHFQPEAVQADTR